MHPRAEQIVAWWAAGFTLAEIGMCFGWSKGHMSNEMYRLRAKGYDLPYRRRPRRTLRHRYLYRCSRCGYEHTFRFHHSVTILCPECKRTMADAAAMYLVVE
jgi:ribosomal protein S27E